MEYEKYHYDNRAWHVNIGIIILCIGDSLSCLKISLSISDRLISSQFRVIQGDWLKVENGKKSTLNINMPYSDFRNEFWGWEKETKFGYFAWDIAADEENSEGDMIDIQYEFCAVSYAVWRSWLSQNNSSNRYGVL